jgi:hypothetical protein
VGASDGYGEPTGATIDVQMPSGQRRIDRGTGKHAGVILRSAMAAAPERLLLAFLWFAYVAAGAYVSGFFRPAVVFPTTAIVVLLTWRLAPDDEARDWKTAVGSMIALAVAGAWFLLNLPYLAERVEVTRDPDLYTLTALWLFDHASPSIPMLGGTGSLGFPLTDGALRPQGNHLVSGVSATAGWVFGQEAIFWGNLACGAAALLALYVLARRVVGPFWGLVPVLALAGSLPMLHFSRALYSEPLAMTFTFLGASLVWGAWKRDSLPHYFLAGVAFGGVALARVDGTLPLLGVLVGLTLAAFLGREDALSRRRWAAVLVLLGSSPGVALGYADLYFHTGIYLDNLLAGQLRFLMAGVIVAALIAIAGAFTPVRGHWRPRMQRLLSRATVPGAALIGVVFAVLMTRPWWYVSRGDFDNGIVSQIQDREGLPIDGTRLYAEDSFQWISWYYGWPVLLVGLAGLLVWLIMGTRPNATHLLWLSALFIPSAVLYLAQPNITPDQIWAMRRFLPVVVPGILLSTVWLARGLSTRGRFGTLLAAVLVISTMAWPLTTVKGMWSAQNKAGALAGNRQVCQQIDDRPTIVTGVDSFLPTIRVLCDVPAYNVPEPTPQQLAAARQALGGGPVVLVTHQPGSVPWVDAQPPPPLEYRQTVLERSLTGPPDEVVHEVIGVTLGLVRQDGSVVPLTTEP